MPKPSRWPRCVTRFGVVPICRALAVHGVQIAPRTYWARRSAAPSKRALGDATITEILAIYEPDAAGKRPPPEWPVRHKPEVRSELRSAQTSWGTLPPPFGEVGSK